jgi:hypothetical protein
VRRAPAVLLLVLAGGADMALAQGFRFSHPELKARRVSVAEYQAIGRDHDGECQARALDEATRRYPGTAQPPLVASKEHEQRDRERAALIEREYVKCMEAKGWERVAQ